MPYNTRNTKISQFTKGTSLTDATQYSSVQNGVNKTFTQAQLIADFADVYGASLRTYATQSELVADDIALGEYAIVEENNYSFYKITNDAATAPNIGLTSGLTATHITSLIRSAEDYAELRSLLSSGAAGDTVSIASTTNTGINGDGVVVAATGSEYTDNGGTIIVANGGTSTAGMLVWLRPIEEGTINVLWFEADNSGATGASTAINAAILAAQNAPLSIAYSVKVPTGVYKIDASLNVFTGLRLDCDLNVFFNCAAAFVNNSGSLNDLHITGFPKVRSDDTYTGDLFVTDSLSYSNLVIDFDGRNVTTGRLFACENLVGTTHAYNDIRCDFSRCLNSTDGAVYIEDPSTFFDFTGSNFNSNGRNFTIFGKNHQFGPGTAIEKSLTNGSLVYSPVTSFNQCWIEQDLVRFKNTAYGCSIIDCRTRGGTLDVTDFHLLNWIEDETIKEFFNNKHSPGLNYREGNRQLKTIHADRPISLNNGLGLPYTAFMGVHGAFSIVGYGFYVMSGGTRLGSTDLQILTTNDTYKDDPLTASVSVKNYTPLLTSYSTNDVELVTWTDDSSVYHDQNPTSGLVSGIMVRWSTSEASGLRVRPFLLIVEQV